MHSYVGVNPISFGITAGPGVVLNPQPSGYGVYSLPQVADAGDPRSAANLSAGIEANRDCINWLTWRTIDWVSGGNWNAYTAIVQLGNYLELSNLLTVTARGSDLGIVINGGPSALGGGQANGQNSAGSYGFQMTGQASGYGSVSLGGASGGGGTSIAGGLANAGNGNGHDGFGAGTGSGLAGIGGGSAGAGVKGTPGVGGQNALWAASGCVYVDTPTASTSTDPGPKALWQNSITKAQGIVFLNAGTLTVNSGGGLNIQGVSLPTVDTTLVQVTFKRAITNPVITLTAANVSTSAHQLTAVIVGNVGSGSPVSSFMLRVWDLNAGMAIDFGPTASPLTTLQVHVHVDGST